MTRAPSPPGIRSSSAKYHLTAFLQQRNCQMIRVILNSTYVARYDILAIPPKGQGHIFKSSYLATEVEWKMTLMLNLLDSRLAKTS